MKKVTIKDIAKEAGVSTTTVSKVINGKSKVSKEMRLHIQDLIDKYGYVPSIHAQQLVKQNSKEIGLMLSDVTNPYYSEMLTRIMQEAQNKGYDVHLFCNSGNYNLEEQYLRYMVESRFIGMIISPVGNLSPKNLEKYLTNIPSVFLSSDNDNERINTITTNNEQMGKIGATHLIECGCKNILYIGSRKDSKSHQQRLKGVYEIATNAGIRVDSLMLGLERNSSVSCQIETTINKFKEHSFNWDGIFAGNDIIALGIMSVCKDHGLSIPNDVKLIGSDNTPYSALPGIMLTTIDHNLSDIAKESIQLIESLIQNSGVNKPQTIIVEPSLIKRLSTKL